MDQIKIDISTNSDFYVKKYFVYEFGLLYKLALLYEFDLSMNWDFYVKKSLL